MTTLEDVQESLQKVLEDNIQLHNRFKEFEDRIGQQPPAGTGKSPGAEKPEEEEGKKKPKENEKKPKQVPDNNIEQDEPTLGAGAGPKTTGQDTANINVQQEFIVIKDSLARVKLPNDLKVNDTFRGVARKDQPRSTVVSKCARYGETLIKLLSALDPENVGEGDIQDLTTIAVAQIRYLQEEHALMLVNSNFGDNVEKIYRTFRTNTSAFSPDAISSLEAAVSMANHMPDTNSRGRGNWGNRGAPFGRGGYRGGSYRGGRGYGQYGRGYNNAYNPGQSMPHGRQTDGTSGTDNQ